MVNMLEGELTAGEGKIAIVISRFNDFITSRLLDAAVDSYKRHGGDETNLTAVWAPGAFELPLLAKKLAESGDYKAVICLGAVIRGNTDHYDYVAGEAAKGIAQASMSTGVPVIFGVITADTLEQAIDRAGAKLGNTGGKAMLTAIEMINLTNKI